MGIEQNHRQFRGVFTGFQPEIVAGTMRGQLVRQKTGFHGQVTSKYNLSGRRRVSTDKLHSRRQQKSGKAVVALLRIYQRIIGEQLSDAENTKRL